MSESNIKELTKSPFKGENTDNYDKYFNILHKIFKKYENKTEKETVDKLDTEIEKLMIKIKDPLEAYIYGTILHDNNFHEYAEMFTKKAQDLGYDINESNENVLKGDNITIYWKGLSVDKGLIGNFIVSPKLHEKIEKEFKSEISIDFNDENVETFKLNVYKDVVNAMKKTEYGKTLFKEAVGTIDLPKDIAKDILPAIEQEKGEDGTYTVKDLENTMLVNGASLKLLDDVVSELVNMGFDFDTEDEKDNDYTMEENNTNKNNRQLFDCGKTEELLSSKEDKIDYIIFHTERDKSILNQMSDAVINTIYAEIVKEYSGEKIDESRETTDIEKEVFMYLNGLRESGIINVFFMISYIMDEFPDLDREGASALFLLWRKNFNYKGDYNEINESNKINEEFDKDKRKEMSREIKRKYPNFRFSIRGDWNHISVDILSGPINFLKDKIEKKHLQVNYFWIKKNWSGEAEKMLSDIYEIINSENYTVSEDGDYNSIPTYYIMLSIGQWDRPYIYNGDEVEDEVNINAQDAVTESLSSKEDKIDYIIFHTERDKSILNQMSDAVINTIYAEIVKEYSGEIVDVENDIDNNALVNTDDEHNFMTEEELRNFGKTEESMLSFDKFKSVVVEYKDGGFNDNIVEGFKILNPVKHVSEKKFTTTDINEAYKMYESFMRLFEESNSVITEKLRSVTIKYENGDTVNTLMAAGLTDDEIKNYFKVGSYFNIGSAEDNMQKVEEVIINDNDTDDTIENDTIENDTIENDVANENLNEKYKPLVPHKQVMPYAGGLENPWVIYPDSVEAPVKEDYDIVAIKNLIASDNFLRFAYENIMTGEFYEDMKTMYETYIKNNEENMAKMKTFESYAKYIIDETLFVSEIATLMLENMESEITDEIKREIYLNLNELTNYHNELKNNLAISTPKFKFDIKEAFKSNIKEKLNEFKDNKIVLESFNDSNVLDYNNNSVSVLKTVLESVSDLFNTTSLELNSELSVVASLALLKQ